MTQVPETLGPSTQEKGKLLKVVTYPHKALSTPTPQFENFDSEFIQFCQDLLFTMYESGGIGLAAPQVAKSLRVFVLDVSYERNTVLGPHGEERVELKNKSPLVFVNPVIVEHRGETEYEEGCLSFPGVYEKVKRFDEVSVNYQNEKGEEKTIEADGLLAICIQHELDHLDGITFLDRMGPMRRAFYQKKFQKKRRGAW